MAQILVVDDEVGIRELLSEILSDEGHSVQLAENATAARSLRARGRPDLVLLDIWMPDADGITLLKEWATGGQLTMPVIMMSGHGTIDTAVEATRIGAMDFLEKPIALQKLLATVKRALRAGESRAAMPLSIANFGRSVTRRRRVRGGSREAAEEPEDARRVFCAAREKRHCAAGVFSGGGAKPPGGCGGFPPGLDVAGRGNCGCAPVSAGTSGGHTGDR